MQLDRMEIQEQLVQVAALEESGQLDQQDLQEVPVRQEQLDFLVEQEQLGPVGLLEQLDQLEQLGCPGKMEQPGHLV